MYQYPFTYHRVVRFQDTDAAGVVYFANVLSICHEAYEAWLAAIGINLKEFFSGQSFAIPIVHAEIDFLQPMFCGETYAINLTPTLLNDSQFRDNKFQLSYAILLSENNTHISRATTLHVCIDPQTRTRTFLPSELLEQMQEQRQTGAN